MMRKLFCILMLLFVDSAFAAIDCGSLTAIPTTKEECAQCPNRDFGIDLLTPIMLEEKQDVCYLKECPDGYFFDSKHKNCLPCDYETEECLTVSPEECAKCPNRRLNKYKSTIQCEIPCPKEKPAVFNMDGFEDSCQRECLSCAEANNNYGFWAEDCSICPGFEIEEHADFVFGNMKYCLNKNPKATEDEEDTIYYEPEIVTLP